MTTTEEQLEEVKRLVVETCRLIDTSSIVHDAATSTIIMAAYLNTAKQHGIKKEQILPALAKIWDDLPDGPGRS